LGVRPDYDGLQIDPCIPPEWQEFSVTRRFRGATYQIHISNPEGVSKGVRSILVNGENLAGTVLPVFVDGGFHKVEVVMG